MRTFSNPVHPGILGDPFVLKVLGRYFAYGTPAWGPIPILTSTDLVTWHQAGEALGPPAPGTCYWAPEVAYDNGSFYLYYSVGGEEGEGHQLRVAVAGGAAGPFSDRGCVLDPFDPFTIDAHPFRDDDGTWYLFYSRDFLAGDRVGTGIVVDRLLDMVTLAGERATVLRPHAEWQIYERQRTWSDRVGDWYTVEGPFVRRHDGRYWCLFSGGAWRAENYGVGCAVADHPLGPYAADLAGESAGVLRTRPGEVVGPGHASVAVAPDNLTDYLVYHAWDPGLTGRYMCLDRLDWTGDGPVTPGPLAGPQPAPPAPAFRDLFDEPGRAELGEGWLPVAGRWRVDGAGAALAVPAGPPAGAAAAILAASPAGDQLVEVNVGCPSPASAAPPGAYGAVVAWQDAGTHTVVEVCPAEGLLQWRSWRAGEPDGAGTLGRLRHDFRPAAFHQLLLTRRGRGVEVRLDGVVAAAGPVPADPGPMGLWTSGAAAAFTGVAVTPLAGHGTPSP